MCVPRHLSVGWVNSVSTLGFSLLFRSRLRSYNWLRVWSCTTPGPSSTLSSCSLKHGLLLAHTKAYTHTSHHSQQPGTSVLKCHCLSLFLTCILQPKVERERDTDNESLVHLLASLQAFVCGWQRNFAVGCMWTGSNTTAFHTNAKTFLCLQSWILIPGYCVFVYCTSYSRYLW